MSQSVFVVSSPYQLISATEARRKIVGKNQSCLILCLNGSEAEIEQLKQMAKELQWDDVVEFKGFLGNVIFSFLKRIAFIWRFKRERKGKVDNVFLGDFRLSWAHYLKSALEPQSVFFLDDGNATIYAYQKYFAQGVFFPRRNSGLKDAVEKLLFFPFSRKVKKDEDKILFTSYQLQGVSGMQVVENRFDYLKAISEYKDVNKDLVWFIGSPYSEVGLMDLKSELQYIQEAVEYLSIEGLEICYLSHRRDSAEKLDEITKIQGVSAVKQSRFPVEYAYCVSSLTRPAFLAGFYTSALDSLAALGQFSSIYSFKFPENSRTEEVDSIYHYYESLGFHMVDLDSK